MRVLFGTNMAAGFWFRRGCLFSLFLVFSVLTHADQQRKLIRALYIPLADHYAALVAYERYRNQMKYADFELVQMKNWDLLRAYFQSGDADMAYVMSPLAMDMFREKPHFRWIGLMHRDGNALAINKLLKDQIPLPALRKDRKPTVDIAEAFKAAYDKRGRPTEIGMPHIMSTHTVVLYRYLKEHGLSLGLRPHEQAEILAIAVPPSESPAFLKSHSNRALPAAFEQSLPWADIVETGGFGYVGWYSKDVMPWPSGHVECIALATDKAIALKFEALKEVNQYIHLAGKDIEAARLAGGESLDEIVRVIRKHIPAHTREAIIASLDPELRVINYQNLDIDKTGLKLIMSLAVEGGILRESIDINAFSDMRFSGAMGARGQRRD